MSRSLAGLDVRENVDIEVPADVQENANIEVLGLSSGNTYFFLFTDSSSATYLRW